MADYNSITTDYPRPKIAYAAKTITISETTEDYDVRANTTLFSKINYARELVLRNVGNVSIKFNETDNDSIDLYNQEGINMVGIPISNIYITTEGSAVVRVWITGWN